ncbi:unnamed protein product, partial [Closterium sp. NIES-53]
LNGSALIVHNTVVSSLLPFLTLIFPFSLSLHSHPPPMLFPPACHALSWQLPQWRQVSALLCSHFSRTTTFRAFAIPPLATVPAALASLRSSLSSCPNYTLPSFPLLLPPSPSNLTFLLLPHHISLALATDYLSYSANSQNAPAWLKNLYPGMPVPAGVSNLEFLHALTHHLQSLTANQEDLTTDNRLSRAVSRDRPGGRKCVGECSEGGVGGNEAVCLAGAWGGVGYDCGSQPGGRAAAAGLWGEGGGGIGLGQGARWIAVAIYWEH